MVSKDLSTFANWSNLSIGQHTLKIKAKATGYVDSDLSIGVTFVKYGGALSSPSLDLFGDMLYVTGDNNSEYIDLYADNTLEETLPVE